MQLVVCIDLLKNLTRRRLFDFVYLKTEEEDRKETNAVAWPERMVPKYHVN